MHVSIPSSLHQAFAWLRSFRAKVTTFRVSSGILCLNRRASPAFGQGARQKKIYRYRESLSLRVGVFRPYARMPFELLGPCFKTGASGRLPASTRNSDSFPATASTAALKKRRPLRSPVITGFRLTPVEQAEPLAEISGGVPDTAVTVPSHRCFFRRDSAAGFFPEKIAVTGNSTVNRQKVPLTSCRLPVSSRLR